MKDYTKEELEYFAMLCNKDPNLKYWRTQQNYKIPISMLKDSHLDNIIEFLKNKMQLHTGYLQYYYGKIINDLKDEKIQRLANKTKAGKILYGRKQI